MTTNWNKIAANSASWTKIPDNTASWTDIPKPSSGTTVSFGTPYGLLLAILRTVTVTTDTWTDVANNSASWTKIADNSASWTKVPKAV